jgi:cyclic pyranopterin phosphate synthase
MRNGQDPKFSENDQTKLMPSDLTGEGVSGGTAVDEAIGSHPDPLAPDMIVSPGTAVDEAIGSHPDPVPAARTPTAGTRLSGLTHIDEAGQARMVDVSGKDVTARTATATGRVLLSPAAIAALRERTVPKGDALAVARIAAIQGAKRTPDLIPLCHPIGLHGVTVDLAVADDGVDISVTARTADRTGVEMEALTSVSVAALTLIDMIKAVDKSAVITDVRLEAKDGGKSGTWRRA